MLLFEVAAYLEIFLSISEAPPPEPGTLNVRLIFPGDLPSKV
jgi:hypothetical protein